MKRIIQRSPTVAEDAGEKIASLAEELDDTLTAGGMDRLGLELPTRKKKVKRLLEQLKYQIGIIERSMLEEKAS